MTTVINIHKDSFMFIMTVSCQSYAHLPLYNRRQKWLNTPA